MKNLHTILAFSSLIFHGIFGAKKQQIEADNIDLVELKDESFFNAVHIEKRDFLVLIVPHDCKECESLSAEFERDNDKLAKEFPDITIGYIYGKLNGNYLVRRALDETSKSTELVVKALVKNQLHSYKGIMIVAHLY